VDLGIDGRTAAVAAASAGLGLASAQHLADAGVQVAICGRDRARVDDALATLAPVGRGPHVGLVADVAGTEGGARFVDAAREALGGLDVLVPNAGGPPRGDVAATPIEAYQPALELNLLSTIGMCTEALPTMIEAGWGRIVAITSLSVRQPMPQLILSNTARAGATAFLKTLAREVAGDGVTVNSVQPGLHVTDRLQQIYGDSLPDRPLGDPADFGQIVAFLCSEQAKFVTGAALNVDGGDYQGLQ